MKSEPSVIMRLALLFSLALAGYCPAQRELVTTTIQAAALQIAGEHSTLWLRTGAGKDPIEISLNTRTFGRPIKYSGPPIAAFYGSKEEASAEKPPKPLCTVEVKDSSTLIVLAPSGEPDAYLAFAVNAKEFPYGAFHLVNLSKISIHAEMGETGKTLSHGQTVSVPYKGNEGGIPVRFIAEDEKGEKHLIRQTSWIIAPDQRELVFFFPNPANGLATIRHFMDSRDPDE